ncbi:MAG: hypothetical protein C5B45_03805, partial [Chlamydiae bacterium]
MPMTITRKNFYLQPNPNAEIIEGKTGIVNNTVQFTTNGVALGILASNPYAVVSFKQRQLLQYNPRNAKNLQLFAAISKHDPQNTNTVDEIKSLLEEVDINHQDHAGDTFLHAAVQEGHRDIVELLVKEGADVTMQNKKSKTPLDLANNLDHVHPSKQEIIDLVRPRASNIGQIPQPGTSSYIPQSNSALQTYPASGLKHSLHGNIYQLKLLMLFMHRGMKERYNFRLSTEWDAAEKFD